MDNELVVTKTITINTPVSKLWEALMSPDYTKKYMFGLEVIADWKPGSSITWKGVAGGKEIIRKGKVLRVDSGKLLQVSDFNPDSGAEDTDANYAGVTYSLSEENSGTMLTVVEDNFNGDVARRDDSNGFWEKVLPKLKSLLESSS